MTSTNRTYKAVEPDPFLGQFSDPANVAFVQRHSDIATANEIRPHLYREKREDGAFLVVPTVDTTTSATDDMDRIRAQALEAFTLEYFRGDYSPVDPAALSFRDSVRAFGAYKKAARLAIKHTDQFFSIADRELSGLGMDSVTRFLRSVQFSAQRLVTELYKASLSPETWLLSNSINVAAQEGASPGEVKDFVKGLVAFERKCFDEFKQLNSTLIRRADESTLESAISGNKNRCEVSKWLHTDRESMITKVATDSKYNPFLHDGTSVRTFGDTLRPFPRTKEKAPTLVEPEYVKFLMSCLGGENTARAKTATSSGDTTAHITDSQPGSGGASTSENQPIVSTFNADAVRKFLARDVTDEDGRLRYQNSVEVYVMK